MRSTIHFKFLSAMLASLLFTRICAQNIVKVISITPGENAVTSTLPFDRPVILKWVSKEQVIIKYAGLITISKGNVSDFYKDFAQSNDFFNLQDTTFGDKSVVGRDQKLVTSSVLNSDGKYELNIFLPPLNPNKFYDVKLLRRPVGAELDLYVDLFRSITDNEMFEKKLRQINSIKTPFEHVYISGPNVGKLRTEDLQTFYNTYLTIPYAELTGAGTDKDKIAAAIAKIKDKIINSEPASGLRQALAYIEIFKAVRASDDALLKTKIHILANMQKGFLPVVLDDQHIGSLTMNDLKAFYNAHSEIADLLNQFDAAPANSKDDIRKHLASFILRQHVSSDLPFADDIFLFGQTLSSSTAVLDFDTRTGFTITPDFGYVYYGFQKDFGSMTPYVGFQLEFRYFDKNIPFSLIRPKNIFHYLSFTTGLSLTSIKKEGKRDDFFANKSLLTGIGIRLSSATRITLGAMWFNREDTNPLIDNKHLTATPFAGISIDLKLKSILNDFYSLSPTKKP